MRFIVTRPPAQAAEWVQALRSRGLQAEALPLIHIAPAPDPEAVRGAWRGLAAQAWVMFVSANAVEQFFALKPAGADWPATLAAGSTGPGTSAALRAAGVRLIDEPAADGARFDSEALWELVATRPWAGRPVLLVRGEEGRDWLAARLTGAGADVRFVAAYRRLPPSFTDEDQVLLAQALAEPSGHCWLFSSSEAAGHLARLAPAADWSQARAAASHTRIADAVRQLGFGRVDLIGVGVDAVVALAADR